MYLERLDIHGFKSFAAKTIIHFDRGITAIVGPNGSGKSNIVDAIRWALGEQSLKSLRGKKSQDIIFFGSLGKSRLGLADVRLTFNNQGGGASIEYPEFFIGRTLTQEGEGEYFLNRRKIRLQDLLLLLAEAQISQKGYSVIGQGMIDAILLSSPQERKMFFDEAVGVRPYEIKREQASLKLVRTDGNLKQAEALAQEIEPRLRFLTRQVKRWERRAKIEQEYHALLAAQYIHDWSELEQRFQVQKQRLEERRNEQRSLEAKLEELRRSRDHEFREENRLDLFTKLEKEYEQCQEEKTRLLQQQMALKNRTPKNAFRDAPRSSLEQRKRELQIQLQNLEDILKNLDRSSQEEERRLGQEREEEKRAASTIPPPFDPGRFSDFNQNLLTFLQALENFSDRLNAAQNIEDLKRDLPKLRGLLRKFHEDLELFRLETHAKDHPGITLINLFKSKEKILLSIHARELNLRTNCEKKDSLLRERKVLEEVLRENDTAIGALGSSTTDRHVHLPTDEEKRLLNQRLQAVEEKLDTLKSKLRSFQKEEDKRRVSFLAFEHHIQELEQRLKERVEMASDCSVELAKLETRREDLENDMRNVFGNSRTKEILERKTAPNPSDSLPLEERSARIQKLRHQLEMSQGVDPTVEQEYRETSERYQFLSAQIQDLQTARTSLMNVIEELDRKIKQKFQSAFQKINEEFRRYFRLLFGGGKTILVLDREKSEPIEEIDGEPEENTSISSSRQRGGITGIEIHAQPPGKKLADIALLSGGEKALTSIALISAIIANNASPFVVLDEVDAALDESNSVKFAKILKELSKKTQFITITHNRATMQEAGVLYGITMGTDGVSKLLSIRIEDVDRVTRRSPLAS